MKNRNSSHLTTWKHWIWQMFDKWLKSIITYCPVLLSNCLIDLFSHRSAACVAADHLSTHPAGEGEGEEDEGGRQQGQHRPEDLQHTAAAPPPSTCRQQRQRAGWDSDTSAGEKREKLRDEVTGRAGKHTTERAQSTDLLRRHSPPHRRPRLCYRRPSAPTGPQGLYYIIILRDIMWYYIQECVDVDLDAPSLLCGR